MHQEALTKEGAVIFPKLSQFKNFYLAGGTALALQIGHRISVDFDLFCQNDIPQELLGQVKRTFAGNEAVPVVNNPEELTVLIDGVKVTFLKYPFPVLDELVEVDNLKMLDIPELAATKAYTIGRRGSLKDYVDTFFMVSDGYASIEQIIVLADKKYGHEFNSRLFLEQLIYLDDVEDVPIVFLRNPVDKSKMERFFEDQIKKMKF